MPILKKYDDCDRLIIILERVVSATVNWNEQPVKFNKEFLKLQDNFDLFIEEEDDMFILTTKMKG